MKSSSNPRVLILSNTPFYLSDSNGRALGLLLKGIPNKEKIQFCIQGSVISAELIDQCYRITDMDILWGVFKSSINAYGMPKDVSTGSYKKTTRKRVKRTPFSMLLRDMAWKTKMKKTDFFSIASNFQPDIVLWQLGDSGFMAELAICLSRNSNAKLVVYSTEDYYFKDWNYLSRGKKGFVYPFFYRGMRSSIKKAMTYSSLCICNTPQLAYRFRSEFDIQTEVIMQSANDVASFGSDLKDNNTIMYAGNLGLNRHDSLIKIARALYKIDPVFRLEVYGYASEAVKKAFLIEPNIIYKGFVSYEMVVQRIHSVRLLVHAESFDPFFQKDLKAAFSTKIPDSLASGTPLFLFAPDGLAETQYLKDNSCAFVCSDIESLESALALALKDDARRAQVLYNSVAVVHSNHNLVNNQKHMLHLLKSIIS